MTKTMMQKSEEIRTAGVRLAEPSFSQDIKKMMDAYNALRKKWIEEYGSDEGFDKWFSSKLGIK